MTGLNLENSDPHRHREMVTIIVNGRRKKVAKNEDLTFDEVIALAFENPPTGDGVQFTIQYTRGHGHKPEGALLEVT